MGEYGTIPPELSSLDCDDIRGGASFERGEKEQYTPSGDPLRVVMTAQRPSRDKIGVRGHEKDVSRREHRDAGGGRRYIERDCT